MKGWHNTVRQNKFLKWILLFSNWLFQGILHSDNTEKFYKIFFSFFFTIIFYSILNVWASFWFINLFWAFCIGHTLNWLINGHITAVFIHRLYIGKIRKEKVFKYLKQMELRLVDKDVICYCAVFGSIARGALDNNSDIDVGFLRKPGIVNAFRGLYFITKERIYTNIKGIPFEGYLIDSVENMHNRFKEEKVPVILKHYPIADSELFPSGISLDKAFVLNKWMDIE